MTPPPTASGTRRPLAQPGPDACAASRPGPRRALTATCWRSSRSAGRAGWASARRLAPRKRPDGRVRSYRGPTAPAARPGTGYGRRMTSDDVAVSGGDVPAGEAGSLAFDPSVAHQARMYDYALGGKDNYAAD